MFKNNYTLKYNLREKDKINYKINSKIKYENLIVKSEKEYEYKIEFQPLSKEIQNDFIIRNTRYDFKNFNDKESDLEKISFEIDKTFLETDYRIDQKGKIIKIENLSKLKANWHNKKNEILRKYEEQYEEIQDLVDGITKILNNSDTVVQYFQNYGVNGIFFSELYGELYIEDNEKKKKISIPNFITFFPLPLTLNIITKKINKMEDEMSLIIHGKLDEMRLDKLNIEEMVKANLPEEDIRGLKYEVEYEQDVSFYLISGLVKNCNQIIEVKIYNKLDNKELFKNRIEVKLEEIKEE